MVGIGAFSSEVETGSRKENASIRNLEPRFDPIETEKALAEREQKIPADRGKDLPWENWRSGLRRLA
jgi:hypothetical protein